MDKVLIKYFSLFFPGFDVDCIDVAYVQIPPTDPRDAQVVSVVPRGLQDVIQRQGGKPE